MWINSAVQVTKPVQNTKNYVQCHWLPLLTGFYHFCLRSLFLDTITKH